MAGIIERIARNASWRRCQLFDFDASEPSGPSMACADLASILDYVVDRKLLTPKCADFPMQDVKRRIAMTERELNALAL